MALIHFEYGAEGWTSPGAQHRPSQISRKGAPRRMPKASMKLVGIGAVAAGRRSEGRT